MQRSVCILFPAWWKLWRYRLEPHLVRAWWNPEGWWVQLEKERHLGVCVSEQFACLEGGGKGLLRARKNGQWSSCSGMLLVGARTLRVFHLHIRGKEPYKDIKEVSGQISSNQFLLGDLCCYVCLDTPHPTAGLCLGKVEEQPNSCYSLLRVRKSRVLHILLWPLFSFRLVHMKGRLMLGYSLSWWLPWGE